MKSRATVTEKRENAQKMRRITSTNREINGDKRITCADTQHTYAAGYAKFSVALVSAITFMPRVTH